ncbi:unnamed protein product [Mytilus coruscus]|uniref:Uncharacterized protein n=1 Tax=Mytilus coruscus TaxID=42192 RepID=A0A6J8BYF4_MYTCO|nr:unnamed protein product [Mytilus coruscus]
MITGQSRLFNMMTNFENRLRTIETKQDKLHAKQDKLEQMLTTQCRQETQGLLAIAIDDDSDDENSISEDMTIPAEDLVLLKRAHSRNMFNWNGCGINAKREVCPRVKVAVRQYVVHYNPECRKEETFRIVVVHRVNEV